MTAPLPCNWETWPLADVGGWSGGGTPTSTEAVYWDGDIPWVTPKDMKTRRIASSQDKITRAAVENSAAKMIDAGSVLFVTRSGILAHSFPVATTSAPVTTNQDLKSITPVSAIDAEYLAWALRAFERTILKSCSKHGTTVHSIEVPALKRLGIPVPPFNEQRRIVAKIEELFSKLDEAITCLETARDQVKAYRLSVLRQAFDGRLSANWRKTRSQADSELSKLSEIESISNDEVADLPVLPAGWAYARLGDFIERIDAGKSFRCDERIPGPKEIGVAKVSAVTWGEYDEDESKTCRDAAKVNADYFIQEGDFLFSRANTIELVGACVIARNVRRKVMLSDKTLRLRFSGVPPRYVLYYLRSHLGRKEIMRRSTGNQESMRNIGQDRIRNLVAPMCSFDEAEYIQERIQEIFSSADQTERDIEVQLKKATTLRESILKQAFSGQLVAQDPMEQISSDRTQGKRGGGGSKNPRNSGKAKRRAA